MPKPKRLPDHSQQQLLDGAQVELATTAGLPEINRLLDAHHYLGSLQPVGERLHYIARDAAGQWLAVLIFSAAAKHLKQRDQWIGWSEEQRRRRHLDPHKTTLAETPLMNWCWVGKGGETKFFIPRASARAKCR